MNGKKEPERRSSRRVKVTLPLNVRGTDSNGVEFDDSTDSYNLSRGGASFSTRRPLETGQTLDLSIPRPGETSPFETRGKVSRIIETGQHRWEVAVKFTGPRFQTYQSETT